ncbi:hypothetical protein JCM14469_06720 [Desulfatiferula olefinivorans]
MNRDGGFTLVEIIAVLLLMGIVAALVVAGGLGLGDTDEGAAADVLKTHLRYAQSRAMNGDRAFGIVFSGGGYSLVRDPAGTAVPVRLPGESALTVPLPAAVSGSVTFDTWGRPSGMTSISLGGRIVTITPDTGFVP